jgi:hypothetical protein
MTTIVLDEIDEPDIALRCEAGSEIYRAQPCIPGATWSFDLAATVPCSRLPCTFRAHPEVLWTDREICHAPAWQIFGLQKVCRVDILSAWRLLP